MHEQTIVVIPTYNEKENITTLIESIKRMHPRIRIVVVDDDSPDKTGDVVHDLTKKYRDIRLISRTCKKGFASACLDAFATVLTDATIQYVITMDADFSHDPQDIKKLLEKMKEYDIVVGSRYVHGGSIENWSIWRRLLSKYGNIYAHFVMHIPIHDLTTGFVAYRHEILKHIIQRNIESHGYAFLMEIKYVAHMLGARITEVPIIFRERKSGESKLNIQIIREGIATPFRLRIKRGSPNKSSDVL